jgi:hypothetical protein
MRLAGLQYETLQVLPELPIRSAHCLVIMAQGKEGGTVYFILASPPDNRGGILLPMEGNKFQVMRCACGIVDCTVYCTHVHMC